jgi:hypothetical protein
MSSITGALVSVPTQFVCGCGWKAPTSLDFNFNILTMFEGRRAAVTGLGVWIIQVRFNCPDCGLPVALNVNHAEPESS